jgi:sporulation protein YtfJ
MEVAAMMEHPIEQIMQTTLENLKDMIDVNTIVGDSMVMADGTMIVPVSKVCLGFISGGGEYPKKEGGKPSPSDSGSEEKKLPFAGGAGVGVNINPMAFLVVSKGKVQLLPVEGSTPYDRLAELIPRIFADVKELVQNGSSDDDDCCQG